MIKIVDTRINNISVFALKSDKDVKDKVTKVLGATYDIKNKVWHFPSYYPFGLEVYSDLEFLFGSYWEKDPSVDKRLEALNKIPEVLKKKTPPKGFMFKTNPMDHQIEGLIYAIFFMRLGLFWECGAGKTKTAIDAIRFLKQNTLYLCPTRLVENTVEEFSIHAFEGEVELFPIIGKWTAKKKMAAIDKAMNSKSTVPKIYIIGYETVSSNCKSDREDLNYALKVSQLPYSMAILDESHKLRSVRSNISEVVSNLMLKAYRRILMTGTPSLGNPLHLYVQFRVLMPWKYKNYFAFKNKFVVTSSHDKNIVVGFKNLHLLRRDVDKISIRKTKEECLDLPERQVIIKKIPFSKEQYLIYDEIEEGIHESVEYNPITLLKMIKLHQVCGGTLVTSPIDDSVCDDCIQMPNCIDNKITPFTKRCVRKDLVRPITITHIKNNPKLNYLLELLDILCNGEGKKVILWYKYQQEYLIIKEALKAFTVVEYNEHADVTRFQNEEGPMIFLAQIQQSSGITLTAAKYTIYYSSTYDLEHYLQSRDRMYRKGQTQKTTEYHLVMEASIDEEIIKRTEKKELINFALLAQQLGKRKFMTTKISL